LTPNDAVAVHARNDDRLTAVRDLLDRGASAVTGDLSDLDQTRGVASQVNRLGPMDAVIHNAGVYTGRLWVPETPHTSCDLLIFVEQPAEPIEPSDAVRLVGRPLGEWS
jgi:NAD(P)-dependent dehydrogenase (short-subunit alcohol dehydrogenase family)